MIKITKKTEKIPVYDIEVKDNHNFFANGLCVHNCEISLPSHSLDNFNNIPGEIGACILGNMNLGYSKESDIPKIADFLVRFLDNLIDESEFVLSEIEYAARKRRALGIGISNLFGYLAKSKQFYNLKDTREDIHNIMELFYYNLLKASNELAKERGKCELFDESIYSNGKFIFERYIESGIDYEFENKQDWESLRKDIKEYGLRHSSLCAIPPAGNCISEKHTIETYEGNFNLKDICNRESINYNDLKIGWYDLKSPLKVPTFEGDSVSNRFYYNGEVEVIEIETDSSVIEVTANHELLVERNGNNIWVAASLLELGDTVVCKTQEYKTVKNIKMGKKIKTWDLEVEKYHNYFLNGGIISHNSSKPSSATPGIEPPRELATIKKDKNVIVKQLVPFFKTSKKYYTTAWGVDFNNFDYLELVKNIQKFVDQSISLNMYYNTLNSKSDKIEISQLLDEIVTAFNNGIKAFYYANFRTSNQADGEAEKTDGCAGGGCSV